MLVTDMTYAPRILSAAYEIGLLEAGYAWVIVDIHERFVSVIMARYFFRTGGCS